MARRDTMRTVVIGAVVGLALCAVRIDPLIALRAE